MNKYLIGCLGIAFVVGMCVIGAIAFFFFTEFPVLDAQLIIPSETTVGSTITMVVTMTNTNDKSVKLDSIDIGDTFLEGFQVLSVDPDTSDTMHSFGMRTWFFEERVEPGDTLDVRFELKAVLEGHFSGDVDVCNPTQDFTTRIADVVVHESATVSPGDDEAL